jgi:signal transduction histidine kinase
VLPTDVDAEGVERYPSEVEAAVYFCCLEAMQNAGKYAGDGARVTVSVVANDGSLTFDVADDGPGFDPRVVAAGHGFENMRDRLGAVGGSLVLDSAPGEGSHIRGSIPVAPLEAPEPTA